MGLGISLLILASQSPSHKDSLQSPSPSSETTSFRSVDKRAMNADVVEVFWYGCPHCLRLESSLRNQFFHDQVADMTLESSTSTGPDSYKATFLRIPAVLNDEWVLDARLYYALEFVGMADDGHYQIMSIFQKNRPRDRESMLSLLREKIIPSLTERNLLDRNLSAEDIDQIMFSPGTDKDIEQSREIGRAIGLTGVPVMVVGGNKVISLGVDASYDTMGPKVISLLGKSQ